MTYERKDIGGHPHWRIPCFFCGELIWVADGRFDGTIRPLNVCNTCNGKPNAKRHRSGNADATVTGDINYHGSVIE